VPPNGTLTEKKPTVTDPKAVGCGAGQLSGPSGEPVARISTTREVHLLHGADGAVLAEFCDDRVTAGRAPTGPTAEQRWGVGAELVDPKAKHGVVDTLCGRLLDAGGKPPGYGSKLARVLDTPHSGDAGHQATRLHRAWPTSSTNCWCGPRRARPVPTMPCTRCG